jgi:hypothetical protein
MPRMIRGAIVLSFGFVVAACGSGAGDTADAPPLIHQADATPLPPDAFVCTMTECGPDCVDLTSDPLHCGDCTMACQSGASCVASDCVCPPGFVPASLVVNLGLDTMLDQLPGAYVAVKPYIQSELDVFAVAYPTTGVVLGGAGYDLSTITPPAFPFVAAGYDVDPNALTARAAFVAVSGTLTLDVACAVGASGNLSDATFQAVGNLLNPMVDPLGCTFNVASVDFVIGTPANCP